MPAIKQWRTYNNGAANKNENSIGSVIPVRIAVKVADNNKPKTLLLFSGLAVRYKARAAPGIPNK